MEKEQIEKRIRELQEEYRELVLDSFSAEAAWKIGCRIREKTLQNGYQIAASVTLNRKRLFYMAVEETTPINERWIHRKENTVYTFFKSSYEMSLYMKLKEDRIEPRYGLKDGDYAAAGGCVPVIVKNVGFVGTVAVSGLTEEEDHNLVVETLKEYQRGLL